MAETNQHVKLIGKTSLNPEFFFEMMEEMGDTVDDLSFTDIQAIVLTAIRTCYSAGKPSEIVMSEGAKYFGTVATDGKGGNDAERLIRHIVNSKHTSTLEHVVFNFAVEGVSRSLLAQLTRHRVGFSFSVQSQRYVRFSSDSKSGGFDYVVPESIKKSQGALQLFEIVMSRIQHDYDELKNDFGIPQEDCRAVLPNAAATNLTLTINLRSALDFYSKRRKGRGAQGEIAELAESIRHEIVKAEPWTDIFFEQV